MHYAPCPRSLPICTNSAPIQLRCNVGFAAAFFDKGVINILNHLLFGFRPRREDYTIRLKALMLTTTQEGFGLSGLIDQLPPQPISRWPTLSIAQLDQVRLPCKHLDGQLAAVFPRHHALNAFDDAGYGGAIVDELLSTILDPHTSLPAADFIAGANVRILKTSPATDVIDQDHREVGLACINVLKQMLKGFSAVQTQPTFPCIGVHPDDVQLMRRRIDANGI
ncbi:hypothetical protein D9M70_274030 [compost metagenome]